MDLPKSIDTEEFPARMRSAVSLAWSIFARKVGSGLIEINKEASMQLQYGFILQQLLPLITFDKREELLLELERGVRDGASYCEVDLVLSGIDRDSRSHKIAVEMKCYRTLASSGGKRGATDIFMKDVYEDFAALERYVDDGQFNEGVVLVMNDLERLVHPQDKSAKCWAYDIADGASIRPTSLTTPIGGKEISITLRRHYRLTWTQHGDFWFLEAQGDLPA